MADITAEHLHHMARRHHATMKKLDGLRDKFSSFTKGAVGVIEVGAGSWLGGAIEGRTSGGTVLNIPINLGIGVGLLVAGHLDLAGEWSGHLNNLGNGFVGSYAAAMGYAFGKRWKETGRAFGGGGHPFAHPYENGWPHETAAPAVHGELSEAQVADIVARMQAAAAASAHP